MAGASTDCTSITIDGIDFSGVSNLVSSKLLVSVGCCSDDTPISLIIDPASGETADITTNIAATGTLSLTDNLEDGDTVVIGAKTYTFQDTLTDVDGNVHIGATASDTIDNLVYAINGTGGTSGTDYAASMTTNTQVTAINGVGDTMTVTAITAGAAGNSIATTETSDNASWAEATLSGGDAGTSVTLYADDLEQGDIGDTLTNGVYLVTASWTYDDGTGANEITKTDETCIIVDCTLRCQVVNYLKEFWIDGDRTKDINTARKVFQLHYAMTNGISCEYCNTACNLYTEIAALFDDDCQCQ